MVKYSLEFSQRFLIYSLEKIFNNDDFIYLFIYF